VRYDIKNKIEAKLDIQGKYLHYLTSASKEATFPGHLHDAPGFSMILLEDIEP
jgi:hypothetical protein